MNLMLVNGKIHTMNKDRDVVEAIFIKENKIDCVGNTSEILELKTEETKVIDLKGRTVLPGFNESHVHLLNYGYSLTKVDCSSAKSADEIIELGKKFIEDKKIEKNKWVLGRGWNQIQFDNKKEPTRFDLDKISTDHPLCFTRICEHVVVANTKAIELCGITKETPQPDGGHFDVDKNGEPTGIFREAARYMIYKKIPDVSKDDIKKMLLNVSNITASLGVTSVHTDDFETFASKDYNKILQAYKELVEEGLLPIRVYEQCLLPEINRLKDFLELGYKTGDGNEYLKIGPLKLLTDGSLGARTALLREPYSDDPTTSGISVFTQEELDELVITAHEGGMQILTHAIGDGAIDMCLNSFERAQEKYYKEDPRFGILHLQITDDEIIDRFKELDIIAYAEPICVNNDLHMAEERVGKERLKTSYNYKAFIDRDIHLCISSDCPVDSLNPLNSIYVAVTRKDYSGYPEGGWDIEKGITLDEAIYGFTMGSAYASFEEDIKGSLEEGKLADMVILSDDIFNIQSDKIKDISVEITIVDGKIVYQK